MMHALMDDIAWIGIGLVVVTILFMIGAGLILLDEGLKAIIHGLRKQSEASKAPPRATDADAMPLLNHPRTSERPNPLTKRLSGPFFTTIWQALSLKGHVARRGTFMRLGAGHHKP